MTTSTATSLADLPGTGVEPPRVVDPANTRWDGQFDVIVVGQGAAGASAALEAREQGASVAVLDRYCGGGTTARSGSVMYAGGGTPVQKALGVDDSPENMFLYLRREVKDVVSEATLRAFCEQSPANTEWVMKHGVRYSGRLFPSKTSYPVPGHSLYFSGNEIIYNEEATPAPRGHLADGIKAFTAFGPAFVGPLLKACQRSGITHHYQTQVTRLLTDAQGRVVGVEAKRMPPGSFAALQHRYWSTLASYAQIYYAPAARGFRAKAEALERKHAITVSLQAKQGVVLATGGFILNKDMTEKYLPKYRRAMRLGTPGDTGSGIALGVSAGGVAERLSTATAWRFINPPADWPKAALVNTKGERYINEASYGATIGTTMMEEHNGEAILILDKKLFEKSIANLNLSNARLVTLLQAKSAVRIAKSAPTLAELAQRCKIEPQALEATIQRYNQAARGEIPDAFGKRTEDMTVMDTGPWYALNMSVGKGDITSVITLGGLRVCEQSGQVLTGANTPIAGLYAAGRAAIGVASQAYISGLSIADGVFSGRRAGRHAAKRSS